MGSFSLLICGESDQMCELLQSGGRCSSSYSAYLRIDILGDILQKRQLWELGRRCGGLGVATLQLRVTSVRSWGRRSTSSTASRSFSFCRLFIGCGRSLGASGLVSMKSRRHNIVIFGRGRSWASRRDVRDGRRDS